MEASVTIHSTAIGITTVAFAGAMIAALGACPSNRKLRNR